LIHNKSENPRNKAITTFVAFNLIGLIPLIPFIFAYIMVSNSSSISIEIDDIFIYSIVFTAISFFSIGMIKGKVVNKSPIKSGLYSLGIGGTAAVVAFIVGYLLSQYII
jgi:vacuolar iron transporter family protein